MPLLFIFLLFFNTPCWYWWHSQVSRLFNYVGFSKSHFKLVVRSECQKQPKGQQQCRAIQSQKQSRLLLKLKQLQCSFSGGTARAFGKQFESSFAGAESEQAVDNFNFRTEDLSTDLHVYRQKKIPGEGSLLQLTRKFSRGMKQEYYKTQKVQLYVFKEYTSLG